MNSIHRQPVSVTVDPSNPGQFFACCGLLELADRLWGGAEGWFGDLSFFIRPVASSPVEGCLLSSLLQRIIEAELVQTNPEDKLSSPLLLGGPFNLILDWWKDRHTGSSRLKPWAGSMNGFRIAGAMKQAIHPQDPNLLNLSQIVYEPDGRNKVEPFYFDARRGGNALSIDVGFSADSLSMKTLAHPAVEFLCLVGLQRFRPMPTGQTRVFDYHIWTDALEPHIASLAACGALPNYRDTCFRFECVFRTDQRKHKAFSFATPMQRR